LVIELRVGIKVLGYDIGSKLGKAVDQFKWSVSFSLLGKNLVHPWNARGFLLRTSQPIVHRDAVGLEHGRELVEDWLHLGESSGGHKTRSEAHRATDYSA